MEDLEALQTELLKSKQRELELEQSKVRLRMAIESTKLGTWDYIPDTGMLTWSDECRKIYGIGDDEPLNFGVFEKHIYPEDKERILKAIEIAMDYSGTGDYDAYYRVLRIDNHEVRWVRAQGKVYFNSWGKVDQFIGTVIDITDRKLAEEKSAKLAAIVESSEDAIISKSLESIITSWNGSAERMFGYTATEAIGKSILMLIPEDRLDEEPKIVSRLKQGERVEHFETKRITKDGKLLDVSLTISPVRDSEGNITGVSKIARDVTEQKLLEVRKNDFVAMVSHELKTPLTSILSYIQLLLGKMKKTEDTFAINALSRTEVQAKKMSAMIHDFLNMARLEEGKVHMHKEFFYLNQLMDEIVCDIRLVSPNHTIELNTCGTVSVYADKDKIGQVLINLITNAIKYSESDTTIHVRSTITGRGVSVSVTDQGVGISAADQKKLFNRFYRVANEKISRVTGFGIGLYLVAEILRYHDTTIEVNSVENVGSTFSFTLPIA